MSFAKVGASFVLAMVIVNVVVIVIVIVISSDLPVCPPVARGMQGMQVIRTPNLGCGE